MQLKPRTEPADNHNMFAGGGFNGGDRNADARVIILDAAELAWHRFQKAFLKATGLDLNEYRSAQIRRRAAAVASASGETIDSLSDRLESGPVLASVVLHQIAIHTTQLFRDFERWIDLQENIVPDIARGDREITAWCTCCANGAEAYSLASILESTNTPGSIVATDVDNIVLEQAVKGRFTYAQGKNARAFLNPNHFEQKSDAFQALKPLSRRISFRHQNVLSPPAEFNYDLIVCRNVAIYLKDAACERLYKNLGSALRPGGYLFVGTTERLFAPDELGFQAVSPCFYRKLN